MGSVNLQSTKYAYVTSDQSGNISYQTTQRISYDPVDPKVLLHFEQLPAALRFKPIATIKLYLHATITGKISCSKLNYSDSDFDTNTVSYNNMPSAGLMAGMTYLWRDGSSVDDPERSLWLTGGGIGQMNALAILRGQCLWVYDFYLYSEMVSTGSGYLIKHSELYLDTPLSSNYKPYLEVDYGDTDVGLSVSATSQTGGYLNPHIAQEFSWYNAPTSVYSLELPEQASAVFVWKEIGSQTEHTVSIADGTRSVTIPAETFPGASEIQWQVRVTSTAGGTYNSSWYTLSTADTLATATLEEPVSAVVDGGEPVTFRWSEGNDSGSVPTGADLEYSEDGGVNWTQIAHVSGTVTEYTVAADFFNAGDVYWRVRVYNIDGVAGEWSRAKFVVFAAPAAPFVSSDGAPFATISWQSSGQEAYELTIDGKTVYGPTYGRDVKRFTLPLPLKDGTHSASVRIQGMYGLWSQPGSVIFSVENTPSDAVVLQAECCLDAELRWETESPTADFLIFRDGVQIGHTAGYRFVDRFVLGEHVYTVINRLPDGNYSQSDPVKGRMRTCAPMIAAAAGGEWIPLTLSEQSTPERRFSWSMSHTLRHVTGARYPVLELAPYENKRGSYDVAFPNAPSAEPFLKLKGKICVIKTPPDRVLIGALTSLEETDTDMYISYRFSVDRVHWEDFIDDENG